MPIKFKKYFYLTIGLSLFLVLTGCTKESSSTRPMNTNIRADEIILFYGAGCPHCQIVYQFISDNKIKEKIQFHYLEVWSNKENADLLRLKSQKCHIAENQVVVPFLWDGKNCYQGEDQVVKYFLSLEFGI
jgi:hypothetical protein